ncbi:hypothetical protein CARUB_v10011027mg [Capsella rubella]|uniref:RING-type E3 ubiquitin transferase n=1 Tax=Capsella rubella TaxID=81985 RepID=R0IK19_9BRAS|nr:E3 ubiquitin-protein ligase CIP8 [Capsella rubella]EOA37328.1 hypothetical protein CARUB_v10011027mg [Capsella rubella]
MSSSFTPEIDLDDILDFDLQAGEAALSELGEGFLVSLNETIEEEDQVLGFQDDEHDIVFEFDNQIQEAAPSQHVEVFRVSLNETIEEELMIWEDDEHDVVFHFAQQTEEAAPSQFGEIYRISPDETMEEAVLGLEYDQDLLFAAYEEAAPFEQLEEVVPVDEFALDLVGEHNVSFDFDHQTAEVARSPQLGQRFLISFGETIEEDAIGFENGHGDTFVGGEVAPTQLGRVALLVWDNDAEFISEHQIEEGARSRSEEAFQVWVNEDNTARSPANETNTARLRANETNTARLPASKLAVESLPRTICKKTRDVGTGTDMCPICLEEFNDGGSIVVTLPCGHEFDEECLVKWFLRSHVCPLCRYEMPYER